MLKIPFGKDQNTGRFYDPSTAAKEKLQCLCNECGMKLLAIRRTNPEWQDYFRHAKNNKCAGGLESLYHSLAKQILKEADSLSINQYVSMAYHICDIEITRHNRRPDAYIQNPYRSLIVEIFYTHRIEKQTLDIYHKNGEEVLEIDISSQKNKLPNYTQLKDLVLNKAPRILYEVPKSKIQLTSPSQTSDNLWPFVALAFGGWAAWQLLKDDKS